MFGRTRRANAATTFTLLVPTMMGSVAMGVDWGQVAVAKLQVQAAADAAALAATTQMTDQHAAERIASAYAQNVLVNGVVPEVTDLTFGVWTGAESGRPGTFSASAGPDPSNNAVRVRTEATVPMYFSGIFGLKDLTVRGEAGAGPEVIPNRAPDHAIVLDTTCSMSRSEIRYEREATEELLDCVNRRSDPESRGGIATFGGVDHIEIPIKTYGEDFDDLQQAARAVQGCRDGGAPCSNTNQASGMEAGLAMLEAVNDTRPEGVGQVIVLMSDGEPTGYNICTSSFFRMYDRGELMFPLRERCDEDLRRGRSRRRGRVRYRSSSTRDITKWAKMARDRARTQEIDIYTVFYGRDRGASRWLRDNVATDQDLHFEALERWQIDDAFVDICVQFTGGSAGMLF